MTDHLHHSNVIVEPDDVDDNDSSIGDDGAVCDLDAPCAPRFAIRSVLLRPTTTTCTVTDPLPLPIGFFEFHRQLEKFHPRIPGREWENVSPLSRRKFVITWLFVFSSSRLSTAVSVIPDSVADATTVLHR